ncbi:MAG: thiamine phosphate synthase [Methanobacteriota archaeon]
MNLEFDLYFITDRGLSLKPDVEVVADALTGGVSVVQYREKEYYTEKMVETALMIKKLCSEKKCLFLVNDRIDVALACDADGVHLGQDDMPYQIARRLLGPDKIIGITVRDVGKALDAEKAGADYLGVSPIYTTSTKLDAGEPGGLNLMREVKSAVKIPCVGIGGINESNMIDVLKAGADGVCMISAVVSNENVTETVKRVIRKIESTRT